MLPEASHSPILTHHLITELLHKLSQVLLKVAAQRHPRTLLPHLHVTLTSHHSVALGRKKNQSPVNILILLLIYSDFVIQFRMYGRTRSVRLRSIVFCFSTLLVHEEYVYALYKQLYCLSFSLRN